MVKKIVYLEDVYRRFGSFDPKLVSWLKDQKALMSNVAAYGIISNENISMVFFKRHQKILRELKKRTDSLRVIGDKKLCEQEESSILNFIEEKMCETTKIKNYFIELGIKLNKCKSETEIQSLLLDYLKKIPYYF